MRPGCTNCLQPLNGPGPLCDRCAEIAVQIALERWEQHWTDDRGPNAVYIEQLKERRMMSFSRARRFAGRG